MICLPYARRLLGAAAAGSALSALLLAPSAAQATVIQNFGCSATNMQQSVAPVGAVSARVTLNGSAGQSGGGVGGVGGKGDSLQFTMPASSQQTFEILVGCQSGTPDGGTGGPGYYQGGNGGGGTYFMDASGIASQALAVAGGGAGGGGSGRTQGIDPSGAADGYTGYGGNGGAAGMAGQTGAQIDGTDGSTSLGGFFGEPGTASADGAGGLGGTGDTANGLRGADGVAQRAGVGGEGSFDQVLDGGGGGGGGGGYTTGGGGGGGGGDHSAPVGAGGGGGAGGTSYLAPSLTQTSAPAATVDVNGSVSVVYTVVGQVQGMLPNTGFAVVSPGQTSSETITYSQSAGQNDPATLGQASIAQTGSRFDITNDTCSNTALAQAATCAITVAFTPTATGSASGTLSLPNNGISGTSSLPLNAVAVKPATALVRPGGSESFGSVTVGATQDKTFSVSNTGGQLLTVDQVSESGSSDFRVVSDQDFCSGTTIQGSCTVQVAYTPSAAGSATATLTIPSNDPSHPDTTVTLTGSGVAAASTSNPTTTTPPSSTPPVSSPPAGPTAPSRLNGSTRTLALGAPRSHVTVAFTLQKASTVIVTLQRRQGGHWKTFGATRTTRGSGRRSFTLHPRFAGRKLTAGRYRLRLQTTLHGVRSTPVSKVIEVTSA